MLDKPKRFKVFFGGRGGGKSWQIAQALLIRGMERKTRVLCTREIQGSIKESVYKLLTDTIDRVGLSDYYKTLDTVIRGPNGTEFIFEGLRHNTTKIKSMEGIDVVWVEEAECISEGSWDLLIPTIRKSGSEIWVSFNPADEQDDTYQRFVAPHLDIIDEDGYYEDETTYVRYISFNDNPWFSDELRAEMETCKRSNPRKYEHIWLGKCNADYSDSIIQPEWFDAALDAHIKLKIKPFGVTQAGFDPADEGTDAKAVATRHGILLNSLDKWTSGDLDEGVDRAVDIAKRNRCRIMAYDSVGIGAGVKLKLKKCNPFGIQIVPFGGADKVTDPDGLYEDDLPNSEVFRNRRAQWWWYLRDRFEKTYRAVEKGEYINPAELISIDSDMDYISVLKSELCQVRRKRGASSAYIQVESKADMKRRGMKSPNMADAVVYTYFSDGKASERVVTAQEINGGWT